MALKAAAKQCGSASAANSPSDFSPQRSFSQGTQWQSPPNGVAAFPVSVLFTIIESIAIVFSPHSPERVQSILPANTSEPTEPELHFCAWQCNRYIEVCQYIKPRCKRISAWHIANEL